MSALDQQMTKILQELQENVVDNIIMIRLTQKARGYVLQRTQAGEYLEGSSPNASQYSEKPMVLPYGLFIKLFGKRFAQGKKKEKAFKHKGKELARFSGDDFKVFRSKSGKTMVLLMGGYKKYRQLSGKDASKVTEHWSSRMMRNLGVLRADKTTGELGFASPEEKQKALWQHQGAGKNRVKHIFMGLTEKEISELTDLAEKLIIQNLK